MSRASRVLCGALLSSATLVCAAPLQAQDDGVFRVSEPEPGSVVVTRVSPSTGRIEGFVVDPDALVGSLRKRVLVEQGLGELARVRWLKTEATASYEGQGAYTFRHRFAEPFAAIEARLDLSPLDDEAAGDLVLPLTALLALAIVLGLYALYRMVAVQVRFADQRNNFVSAVSHELKTPLTAIRMYGEMLRDGMVDSDDKRAEYYATITAETERLSRLINNVLEFSRLQRSERPVHMVVGDVAGVVREVVEVFRPHAQAHGFIVEVVEQADLAAARFDRDALTQVLFNLLDNALKYGASGDRRRIVVRCERAAEGGVQIAVADSGPGVDEAKLTAIFEPFYREQSELTRSQQGTGIGLSLVRGLVERMRGRVEGRNLEPGFEVCVTLETS